MSISMTGSEARLEGDWTLSALAINLDSLAHSLQQIDSADNKPLRIDCGQMKDADLAGLQLLNVWVQCTQFRGMEPFLVNVPDKLRNPMNVLLGQRIIDNNEDLTMTGALPV